MDNCTKCNGQKSESCSACDGRGKQGGFLGLFRKPCESCRGSGTVACSKCLGTGEAADPKIKKQILATIETTISANDAANFSVLGRVVLQARQEVRQMSATDRLRYHVALNEVWKNIDYSDSHRAGAFRAFVKQMESVLKD